ncbi:MAG: DUF4153 domain-containing protein [Pirellulaceae bacterium]
MAGITKDVAPIQSAKSAADLAPPRAISVAGLRELLAIVLAVALADVTLYRGAGLAGVAVLLVAGPLLLVLGSPHRRLGVSFWVVSMLLLLLAARMLWLGDALAVLIGAALVVAFALSLRGLRPYVFDVLTSFVQLALAGGVGLQGYLRAATGFSPPVSRWFYLSLLLPGGAVVLFGTIFILANPDLARSLATNLDRLQQMLADWLDGMSQNWLEVGFWIVTAYVVIGLLRPLLTRNVIPDAPLASPGEAIVLFLESPWYGPLRNMLWAVIGLFAVYLSFEFQTLWFRDFPAGFHYSGYAHEGAAWLTAALALATLMLSLIFRGDVLRDPRLGRLRLLAWIWSGLNLLLALTVYHRLSIYIDFNGMSRMRTIGLFGISTVVVGFVLVLWKIAQGRGFVWLIHRQLWALAAAVYLYALTPVDTLVHAYNVRQILAGDVAPAVQISVHPISAEGYLMLEPLVDCDDPIVRDGVRALLAQRAIQARRGAAERKALGWTTWQGSEYLLAERLAAQRSQWREFADDAARQAALDRFHKYAYQWY